MREMSCPPEEEPVISMPQRPEDAFDPSSVVLVRFHAA